MIHKSTKIIAAVSMVFFCVSIIIAVYFLHVDAKQKELYTERLTEQVRTFHREQELRALTEKLKDTQEERTSLFARILPEDGVIDFLALIEALGKEHGVKLVTNSLSEQPIDGSFDALVMDVDLRGSYEAVVHLITIFEHLPYQVSIDRMQIIKAEGETGSEWKSIFELQVTKFKKI